MLWVPISQGSRAVSEGPQMPVSSWYSGQDPSGWWDESIWMSGKEGLGRAESD